LAWSLCLVRDKLKQRQARLIAGGFYT